MSRRVQLELFKMRTNGEIDIVFGKPADDEPEDLTKLL
jgi:hypothetical protein